MAIVKSRVARLLLGGVLFPICFALSLHADPPDAQPTSQAPPEPWEPKVVLSKAHASTCRKKVGDLFPKMTLQDLAGQETPLAKWLGKPLTLVVFWDADHVYSNEQFRRLATEVEVPFAKNGVSIVTIHVGSQATQLADLQKQYGGSFTCLVDPDGKQFAQVADGKPPRSYLLNAQNQIVWMDVEYSLSTQRELTNAIQFYLQKKSPASASLPSSNP